jgi:phosphohistidine phosphatase
VTLRLDVLRHGAAEGQNPSGDQARRLTDAGSGAIRALGERLAREGWRPARVLTSPYTRAVETAGLVLAALPNPPRAEPCLELTPDQDPVQTARTLVTLLAGDTHVLIVGHQPLLGHLVQYWTGGAVELSPGSFVPLEFADGPRRGAGRKLDAAK